MKEILYRLCRLSVLSLACFVIYYYIPGLAGILISGAIALIGLYLIIFLKYDNAWKEEFRGTMLLNLLAMALGIALIYYSASYKQLLMFSIPVIVFALLQIVLWFLEERYKNLTIKTFLSEEITLPLFIDILLLGDALYRLFFTESTVWFNILIAILAAIDIVRHCLRKQGVALF